MRILVIGSGGREHALVEKLAQSAAVDKIFAAPGNSGTAILAENVDIAPDDIAALVKFAREQNIDLVVPGPELPLVLGIADAMAAEKIPCFGPDAFCARLEGGKSFAKSIMATAGVPTARFGVFTDFSSARDYIEKASGPLVAKADGLAAGKGVTVCATKDQAMEAARAMLENGQFGEAGQTIVIEEKLEGEEVSLLCLCDGETALPLPSAQDHKAVFDGDKGPNTGGMGAYSPAPAAPDSLLNELADLTVRPILAELAKRGHPFKGILYAGLMLTKDGPKVLEYNVRFGDPECEPLLRRLRNDLPGLMLACLQGRLKNETLDIDPRAALGVVLCAKGYPGPYAKNLPIRHIDEAEKTGDTRVYHAGMKNTANGPVSSGGRVLCVTSLGADLAEAQKTAYKALSRIDMPESHFRRDIGAKGIKKAAFT